MFNDLRYALRTLLKSPGFSAVVVLSVGLGIAANATVFCWIQNIVIRPLSGVARQEQLVAVTTMHGSTQKFLSLPEVKEQSKLTEIFTGVVGSVPNRSDMSADGCSEWIYGQLVTANFFSVLGVNPVLGRAFLPDEDGAPGAHPVMVISEALWKRRFGGDSGVVGRTVLINGQSITIVGVVPQAFHGTDPGLLCDFWAPLSMVEAFKGNGRDALTDRNNRFVEAHARLRPGVSLEKAQAALDVLGAQLEAAYPATDKEIHFRVLPLWQAPFGAQQLMAPVLALLLAVSLGVLLIVAVNVANLLLARATGREREIAIRIAIGAGRGRLIRQLLTESLLLALVGGGFGILAASWLVDLAQSFIPFHDLPLGFSAELHWQTLAATLGLTLATGLLFGVAPSVQTSRPRLNDSLRAGGRGSSVSSPHHRLLNVFVVSQIALALTLLVCAGLCLKGLHKARQTDLGFDPDHLLYVGFDIEATPDLDARINLCRTLQQRLAELPGVEKAVFANWYALGFLSGANRWSVDVNGYARQPNEDLGIEQTNVSAGYFAALHIPLISGREFTDRDDQKSPLVAVINEAMARRFWPGENALGRKFGAAGSEWTVIGVARTGKYHSLTEQPANFFYLPYPQWPFNDTVALCLRTSSDPNGLADAVRQELARVTPGSRIWATMPMHDYIQAAFVAQQLTSALLVLLGTVVLALAAIGVYGVTAYAVGQRTHEFGVRLALGAQRQDLMRLVLRRGFTLATVGVVIGLMIAMAVTRLLAAFLYGVSPFDGTTFIGVPMLLGMMTLLACWLPARCAARVDPMVALRSE